MSKSKGLGDTIAKFTEATGIDKLVEKTADLLGIEDCGCTRRKEWVNNLIPYNQNSIEYKELIPQNSLDLKEGVYIFNRNTILNNIQYSENDKVFIDFKNPNILQFKQLFELGIIRKKRYE